MVMAYIVVLTTVANCLSYDLDAIIMLEMPKIYFSLNS